MPYITVKRKTIQNIIQSQITTVKVYLEYFWSSNKIEFMLWIKYVLYTGNISPTYKKNLKKENVLKDIWIP